MEGDTKEHLLQQKHTELKEKMRDLNHGFERLRKISHEGFSQDSGEEEGKRISPLIYPDSLFTKTCNYCNALL